MFTLNLNATLAAPDIFPIYGMDSRVVPFTPTAVGGHVLNQGSFTSDRLKIPLDNRISRKNYDII